MRAKDPFLFVIRCYDISGLRKTSSRVLRLLSIYILLPVFLVLYGMVLINFRYKNRNIFEIAEVVESVSTFSQLATRKLMILLHGPLFEEIFEARSKFWAYNKMSEEAGSKYRQKMELAVSLIKHLWFSCVFSLIAHFCTPFFVAGAVLPDSCWIPNNNQVALVIIYVLEMLFYVEVMFLLGVFDAFFLCMCIELRIQFNLLICTIQSVPFDGSPRSDLAFLQVFKGCARHHSFLLKVHDKLNRIFSEYFLCQYLITIGAVCIQFFILNDESSTTPQILRSIVYILVANLLAALIFLPSSVTEEEVSIYNFVKCLFTKFPSVGYAIIHNLFLT